MMSHDLDLLVEELLRVGDKGEMRDFLYGLLTDKELEDIPTRLVIVRMLKGGVAQHEIAKKLGVGVATVTRGAREIRLGRFKNIK